MKFKAHNHPEKDGWPEAIRCPYCKRWIVEEFKVDDPRADHKGESIVFYNELNFDRDGGFYYCSTRRHSLIICKSNRR